MTKPALPKQKNIKCGLSLTPPLVTLLREKAKETKHGQSRIAQAVMEYGLPFYTVDGVIDPSNPPVTTALEEPVVADFTEVKASAESPSADDLVPDPSQMLLTTKRRRMPTITQQSKSPVPSFVNQVTVSQPGHQPGSSFQDLTPSSQILADGYIPNMDPRGGEPIIIPGAGIQPELDPQLIEMFKQFMAQQVGTPPQQAPLEQPQGYNPLPPPPPQFAASYPPGYTGSPGVTPIAPPPQEQPLYPYPNQQQPAAPAVMQDQFAMNMGGAVPPGPSAQSLLSGGPMMPNIAGSNTNVNMMAARQALGPGWGDRLKKLTAQESRGTGA